MQRIPFNNLLQANLEYVSELQAAAARVINSGWYVLGHEVETFEAAFAAFHGDGWHAVGVANGTDALELALRAFDIGPGDEVITVAHTAVATVNAVERAGARPVLVDIDPLTYTLCPTAAEAAITPRTRCILPVHLYGHPAALSELRYLCDEHGLILIEDCAQAHGARLDDRLVGTWGDAAAFSFYPTKNLGALGDGGAVLTRDPERAARLKRLRNYGQTDRYIHVERGINSRLDELQAALLRVKLANLSAHNQRRRELAAIYLRELADCGLTLPLAKPNIYHVYHLFVIALPDAALRPPLMQSLAASGIGTLIHYPIPVHRQQAYADLAAVSLPVTEDLAQRIVSLPLYVGLSDDDVRAVAGAIRQWMHEQVLQ